MEIELKYIVAFVLVFASLALVTVNFSEKIDATNQLARLPVAEATSSPRDSLISQMRMTFDEEFNGLSLYRDYNGNVTCTNNGTGTWQTIYFGCTRVTLSNNETEVYLDQTPFNLLPGVLSIEARPIDPYLQSVIGPWAKYSSGLITTQYSFSQTYGYFEVRAQMPAGQGTWPAFWLLPVDKSWPPEIDALEAFGDRNPVNNEGGRTLIHYASHVPPDNKICGDWYDTKTDITAGFHTYGVDWEPTGITFYFDGIPYATCPPNPAANKPFYILINLAIGGPGSWPGTPSPLNLWPTEMKIDYVRAYQKITAE